MRDQGARPGIKRISQSRIFMSHLAREIFSFPTKSHLEYPLQASVVTSRLFERTFLCVQKRNFDKTKSKPVKLSTKTGHNARHNESSNHVDNDVFEWREPAIRTADPISLWPVTVHSSLWKRVIAWGRSSRKRLWDYLGGRRSRQTRRKQGGI